MIYKFRCDNQSDSYLEIEKDDSHQSAIIILNSSTGGEIDFWLSRNDIEKFRDALYQIYRQFEKEDEEKECEQSQTYKNI